MRCLAILLILALASCTADPWHACPVPKVVQIPVKVFLAVPPGLTQPIVIAEPTDVTVGEAVRVARERKAELETCNAQLKAIGELKQ